jgi:acetyl/propionyl-CoA carboxylase alpha subunit
MRIVRSEEELGPAMLTASTEAAAAFKNGEIYVEKYDESPRHIEVLEVTSKSRNAHKLKAN